MGGGADAREFFTHELVASVHEVVDIGDTHALRRYGRHDRNYDIAAVKLLLLLVHEVVLRVDDGQDGDLAVDGHVEGALLEGVDLSRVAARALREHPQLQVVPLELAGHLVDGLARLLRVESVDEDDAAQPEAQAERPRVQHLLLGHDRTPLERGPQFVHPCAIDGVLVICDNYTSAQVVQILQSPKAVPAANDVVEMFTDGAPIH